MVHDKVILRILLTSDVPLSDIRHCDNLACSQRIKSSLPYENFAQISCEFAVDILLSTGKLQEKKGLISRNNQLFREDALPEEVMA